MKVSSVSVNGDEYTIQLTPYVPPSSQPASAAKAKAKDEDERGSKSEKAEQPSPHRGPPPKEPSNKSPKVEDLTTITGDLTVKTRVATGSTINQDQIFEVNFTPAMTVTELPDEASSVPIPRTNFP